MLFEGGERVGSVVKHRVTGHLAAAFGLSNGLEVAAQFPVLLMQRGDELTARGVGQPREGLALGTPYLSLRLGVLSERDEDPVDLSVGVNAGLPLGSDQALARESSLRGTPSVMVGKRFGSLRAGLDVGLSLRPRLVFSDDANVRDELGNELHLGAVVATTGEGLRGELDVIASVPFEREGSAVEALAGARMPVSESMEAYALAGVGFGNAPGTPTFRGLLGVAFGSMPPRCVAGGKHSPAQCPDLDDDNDGVKNREDACPLQGGRVDAQGCPVKDADKDGIVDEQDSCPSEAGIPELKGCPARDTDNDTVSDHLDNCPSEAGPADNQGCPARQRQLVVIQQGRIEIKETVYFDTGKATIQKRSFKLLDQVAQVLVAHPELEKVWVEGHTDNVGKPDANMKLSQRRAESVRDYLTKKGVAPQRLEAKGFGQERPITPNTDAKGRATNRRVEFLTTPPEGTQQ